MEALNGTALALPESCELHPSHLCSTRTCVAMLFFFFFSEGGLGDMAVTLSNKALPLQKFTGPKAGKNNNKRQNYELRKRCRKVQSTTCGQPHAGCFAEFICFFLQWHPEVGVTVLTLHKGKLKPREKKHPCLRSLMQTQIRLS